MWLQHGFINNLMSKEPYTNDEIKDVCKAFGKDEDGSPNLEELIERTQGDLKNGNTICY